nr:hypothetical protein [Tanacetum cinerariifolium]
MLILRLSRLPNVEITSFLIMNDFVVQMSLPIIMKNTCTHRLRIGRSNFRLPSDIQSKESTLQLIYDVLCRCPFFKAFLGLYHKRNIDYAFLIWEDFMYQVKHKNHKKSNEMYYPRFKKVIIHHFMSKDPSIPKRNKVNWHYVRDDFLFSMIKVVSRHQNTQQYGAMLHIELTNDEIKNTKAYKEYYAFATREAAPKPKASARRKRSGSDTSITPPTATATPKPIVAATPRLTAAAKGKQPAKATKAKSPSTLLEVAMTEAEQLKLVLKRSRQQMHISQSGGSGTDEGTGSKPRVPDVPTDESEEELSWNSSDDEGADDQGKDGDDDEGDEGDDDEGDESDEGEEDADEDKDGDERDDDEENQEVTNEDEGDGEEDQDLNVNKEEHVEEEKEDELYRDVNINQGRGLQATLEVEYSHVTLTLVNLDGQQESSSVSSQFVTSMLNLTSDVGMESIFATASSSMAPLPTSTPIMTPSTIATIKTISQAPIPPTLILSERIIKEQVKGQVKEQVSRILPRIKQSVNAQLEAEVLTRSSHSSRTSYAVATDLSEMELKKILIEKMEGNKSIQRSDEQRNLYKALVDTYEADKLILDSYEKTNKTLPAVQGSTQTWISKLAKQADSHSSFNELLDTPLDFFNFIMNRLRVDTLTPELLAGPTFELMKGSCKSLIKLEYHLEEPLSLIPDNQGRHVIPFAHFINNDLEYLRGGATSRKYTTSITKTKAVDYGQIKWIEDLVPRTMWIQEPIDYDKYALWGVSHWERKRQQFYGFAVNRESARDVYSKRRIIAITKLKIVEWHNYKHLDWITDVYKKHRHPVTCGRSSTGSRKLPEEAQPYYVRHVPVRSKAKGSVYCLFKPKRIHLPKQGQEKQVDADRRT